MIYRIVGRKFTPGDRVQVVATGPSWPVGDALYGVIESLGADLDGEWDYYVRLIRPNRRLAAIFGFAEDELEFYDGV